MQITAPMVKELRERTGAGMMECKKALTENSGDMEAAIEHMRKSGQAKADKKAGRIAAEGAIAITVSDNRKQASIVEVNCETDFVAKDDQFQSFSNQLADIVLLNNIEVLDDLNATIMDTGQPVEQARLELVTKVGENIQIRRFEKQNAEGLIASYVHGKRIGVLVDHSGGDETLGKDIAMHIAAVNPICVSANEVPGEMLNKERDIAKAQADSSGKSPEIVEKMVQGKVNKFIKENTLLGQSFVKDDSQLVGKFLESAHVTANKFIRFEVGEGLEKRSENFADEVMQQVKKSEGKDND